MNSAKPGDKIVLGNKNNQNSHSSIWHTGDHWKGKTLTVKTFPAQHGSCTVCGGPCVDIVEAGDGFCAKPWIQTNDNEYEWRSPAQG